MKITIGIITYSREKFLREALASALAQGADCFEVLVVDDGSNDRTAQYLSEINDSRVRIITHPANRGRPAARNTIIKEMRGDCLVWLDDDDILLQNALKAHLDFLCANPEAEIVYPNLLCCDSNFIPLEERRYKDVEPDRLLSSLIYENVIPNGGTLIRRSIFERVGGYDESFPQLQDYDFWMRAAQAGCHFRHLNQLLYCARRHAGNDLTYKKFNYGVTQRGRIIKKLIDSAPLEKIFSFLDWSSDQNTIRGGLYALLGKTLFDCGRNDEALELITRSEQFASIEVAQTLKQLILTTAH